MISGPVTLLILDGFGDGPRNAFDATFQAGMPDSTVSRTTKMNQALIWWVKEPICAQNQAISYNPMLGSYGVNHEKYC